MYFPYIRGKQFDLIALKEMVDVMAENSDKVSPIIEPVKNSSTFKITLSELAQKNVNFNVVVNPSVGDMIYSQVQITQIIHEELQGYSNYQIGVVIDDSYGDISYLQSIRDMNIEFNGFSV